MDGDKATTCDANATVLVLEPLLVLRLYANVIAIVQLLDLLQCNVQQASPKFVPLQLLANAHPGWYPFVQGVKEGSQVEFLE